MNHPRYGNQVKEPSKDRATTGALSEADKLAASIEVAVRNRTRGGVRNLSVEISGDSVFLRGRCTSYYTKQLAQTAAMRVSGHDRLKNQIEVA